MFVDCSPILLKNQLSHLGLFRDANRRRKQNAKTGLNTETGNKILINIKNNILKINHKFSCFKTLICFSNFPNQSSLAKIAPMPNGNNKFKYNINRKSAR